MKTDKKSLLIVEEKSSINKKTEITPKETNHTKVNHSSVGQLQLIKVANKFALEGGILPSDQQLLIQDRCQNRQRVSLFRKQENIETIIQKSFNYCASIDVEHHTDEDWFSQFLELAENVSNQTMQDLWAKILSGELARPGSFSLKSLKVFRDLSISDAKLLAKACSLSVRDQSRRNIRIISGSYQKPSLFNMLNKKRQQHINLSAFGLNYTDLLSLAENHLIFIQENESSSLEKNEKLNFNYNSLPLKLSSNKNNNVLQFYKFTPIGVELANLISDRPDKHFLSALKTKLSYHFDIEN